MRNTALHFSVLRRFGTRRSLIVAAAIFTMNIPMAAHAACLTDAEIDAQIGAQVRSNAFAIDTRGLNDRPLCSGLTLAQRIQQMHDAAFPEERLKREALAAQIQQERSAELARRASLARAAAPAMAYDSVSSSRAGPAATAMSPLATRLDALVRTDSRSWILWRYRPGSMMNARKTKVRSAQDYTANGEFYYADGRRGEVLVEFRKNAPHCIEFGNEPACRPFGQPPSHGLLAAVLTGMMSGAASGSSSGNASSGPSEDAYRDNQRDIDRQAHANDPPPPSAPPVEPISPFYGVGPN